MKRLLLGLLALIITSPSVGANSTLSYDAFGSGSESPGIAIRRARGHTRDKEAIRSGDVLNGIYGRGYNGTSYSSADSVSVTLEASENWTQSANGTSIVFKAIRTGSTTPETFLTLDPNNTEFTRTTGYSSGVDSIISTQWTVSPGATGVAAGVYGTITSTGTETGTGHTIGGLFLNGASQNFAHTAYGVEGRVNTVSTATTHVAVGALGLASFQSDNGTAINSALYGVQGRAEVYAADGTTPRSTGTVVGVHIPATIGGDATKKYGVLQEGSGDFNQYAGINIFSNQSFLFGMATFSGAMKLTPQASAPSSPTSGNMYMDSTPNPDELCVHDGAGWQALISGTDANCS